MPNILFPLSSTNENVINSIKRGALTILDFASYKTPGGLFIQGSRAQEESLCHNSDLYNILSSSRLKKEYFELHHNPEATKHLLYTNDMIYVPNVVFVGNNNNDSCDYESRIHANVLVGAAPNSRAIMKYHTLSDTDANNVNFDILKDTKETWQKILPVLVNRIYYTMYYPHILNQSTLILGAFGCGVFGNPVIDVARIYRNIIETEIDISYSFKEIIFVIPDDASYNIFKKVFRGLETL